MLGSSGQEAGSSADQRCCTEGHQELPEAARRPGWVRDAVVQALADHGGPMRVADIHAAVKALVGEDVSPNSVSWALAADVGRPAPSFVRVARGRYALA